METKVCNKCQEAKPLTDFYFKRRLVKPKRQYICKACARVWYWEYYRRNRERILKRNKDRQRGNPKCLKYYKARDKTEKGKARATLRSAVSLGKIKRPSVCEGCGQERSVHGHHEDYSKPFEVQWLCSQCHGEIHRLLGTKT